jgi:hypothetical protein
MAEKRRPTCVRTAAYCRTGSGEYPHSPVGPGWVFQFPKHISRQLFPCCAIDLPTWDCRAGA